LARGGYTHEQIIEVMSKVGVTLTAEQVAAIITPAKKETAGKNQSEPQLIARFPGRPENTGPLKTVGLKWDREHGVWAGPDTEAARAAVTSLGGTVEGAA
jgi:hypothetical protein